MLKSFVLLILSGCVATSCKNVKQQSDYSIDKKVESAVIQEIPAESIIGAYLRINENRYDFGKIKRNEVPQMDIEFEVENIGKTPLLIFKADVSCNCLSVDYPISPIHPEGKAKLVVSIDTEAQEGVFNKTVFVRSNADNDIVLIRIVGEIVI